MFRVYETSYLKGRCEGLSQANFRTMVFCGMAFCSRDTPTLRKNHLLANQFTRKTFLA